MVISLSEIFQVKLCLKIILNIKVFNYIIKGKSYCAYLNIHRYQYLKSLDIFSYIQEETKELIDNIENEKVLWITGFLMQLQENLDRGDRDVSEEAKEM